MIKGRDQNNVKRRGSASAHMSWSQFFTRRSWDRKLDTGTKAEDARVLTACLLREPRAARPEVTPPTWGWALPHQPLSKENALQARLHPHVMFAFSQMKFPPLRWLELCQSDIKLASTGWNFSFKGQVLLCRPGYPKIQYVDHARLKLIELSSISWVIGLKVCAIKPRPRMELGYN